MRQTRILRLIAASAVSGAVVALVPGAAAPAREAGSQSNASAVVRDVNGAVLGTVRFDAAGGRIVVTGRLSGLTEGFHGFHVHAVGVCDPRATDPNGVVVPFLSAGAHLNPAGTTHGHHAGDLSPMLAATDGRAVTLTQSEQLSAARLFDADGSAVIIHALPDNLAHIPVRYSAAGIPGPDAASLATGDAGGRTACGVVTR